jgi:hypothetical protein
MWIILEASFLTLSTNFLVVLPKFFVHIDKKKLLFSDSHVFHRLHTTSWIP